MHSCFIRAPTLLVLFLALQAGARRCRRTVFSTAGKDRGLVGFIQFEVFNETIHLGVVAIKQSRGASLDVEQCQHLASAEALQHETVGKPH